MRLRVFLGAFLDTQPTIWCAESFARSARHDRVGTPRQGQRRTRGFGDLDRLCLQQVHHGQPFRPFRRTQIPCRRTYSLIVADDLHGTDPLQPHKSRHQRRHYLRSDAAGGLAFGHGMASLRAYHGPLVLPERTQFQNVGMEYVAHDRQWLAGTARNRRNRHLRHAGMGRHVACSLHLPELRGASSGRFLLVGAARHAPGLRAASHRRIPQRLLGGKGRQGRRKENPFKNSSSTTFSRTRFSGSSPWPTLSSIWCVTASATGRRSTCRR